MVSAIIIVDNELLIVKNKWKTIEGWTLPCGHIEDDEAVECAIKRELLEETGLILIDEPEFSFVLKVIKNESLIYNFFFTINNFKGNICSNNDPDNIITKVKFFPIKKALSKLMYDDVRVAIKSWIKNNKIKTLCYRI